MKERFIYMSIKVNITYILWWFSDSKQLNSVGSILQKGFRSKLSETEFYNFQNDCSLREVFIVSGCLISVLCLYCVWLSINYSISTNLHVELSLSRSFWSFLIEMITYWNHSMALYCTQDLIFRVDRNISGFFHKFQFGKIKSSQSRLRLYDTTFQKIRLHDLLRPVDMNE
jgi:hypothetical protein